MSENYAVCAVDSEIRSAYFSEIIPPPPLTDGIITRELALAALREIPEIKTEERDTEHLFLKTSDDLYTEMSFLTPAHPMETVSIGFRGGHIELIEMIVGRLAAHVGSLMLYFGSGNDPKLFTRKAEQDAAANP
jgi:hypothetical protein